MKYDEGNCLRHISQKDLIILKNSCIYWNLSIVYITEKQMYALQKHIRKNVFCYVGRIKRIKNWEEGYE